MDVRTLKAQTALSRLGYQPGILDGIMGPKTLTALRTWAPKAGVPVDSRFPLPSDTLDRLLASAEQAQKEVPTLEMEQLLSIVKHSRGEKFATDPNLILQAVNDALYRACARGEAACEMLATMAHECDRFKTMREYAYRTVRYKPWYGRGFIQLTWAHNYDAATKYMNAAGWSSVNLMTEKEQAENPIIAGFTAAWYWLDKGLNFHALRGDFREVTKLVQGSYDPQVNHFSNRLFLLDRARKELGVEAP
jgi:hypothetical protein